MGKTEEVERGATRVRVPRALRPMKAKVDEARLVGMKGEPIPGKPLAQYGEDPSGIFEHLEGHDTVISVPHEDTVPLETRSHVLLEPLIQRKRFSDPTALTA